MTVSNSRRSFIKKTAAVSAIGFPTIMPSYLALGKEDSAGNLPPSKRINLACIGVGGRASGVIPGLIKGGAVPVALCDVDFSHQKAWKGAADYPKAKRFTDFRVMLDEMDKDIDAVSVVVPDHSHFCAAMDAMRRGKHVYVEKPLAHSFDECEMLMKAEKKFNVVTQMGNQGHTSSGSSQFKQMVDNGLIKNVKKIDAWKSPGLWFMDATQRIDHFPPPEVMPTTLDWDLWCGPAPMKPFSSKYHPFNWRAFHLYGMGMLGDWGAHIIDFAHDYLNLGLPTEITNIMMDDHNQVIFPLSSQLAMKFPSRGKNMPECTLTWRDGADCVPKLDERYWHTDDAGKKVEPNLGKNGTLIYPDGEDFIVKRGSHASTSSLLPFEMNRELYDLVKAPKTDGLGHQESFIKACMGEGKTTSPFSVSAPLSQVLCMGAICQYLNPDAPLKFDPKTKQFTNNADANRLLKGTPPRKGWEEYYKVV